jgi:hypothetical protein
MNYGEVSASTQGFDGENLAPNSSNLLENRFWDQFQYLAPRGRRSACFEPRRQCGTSWMSMGSTFDSHFIETERPNTGPTVLTQSAGPDFSFGANEKLLEVMDSNFSRHYREPCINLLCETCFHCRLDRCHSDMIHGSILRDICTSESKTEGLEHKGEFCELCRPHLDDF